MHIIAIGHTCRTYRSRVRHPDMMAPEEKRGSLGVGGVDKDVWRFKEIRDALWGTGTSTKSSKGIWDFSGLRKRLWGR